ncbi:MAG: hypothetical protein AAFU73_23855, partial [Planctomycetota bacterium]
MPDQERPDPPSPKGSEIVKKVVGDASDPVASTLLRGYVGESSEPEHVRLYVDPSFGAYVEIPADDVLHVHDTQSKSAPLGPAYVWVRLGSELKHGHTGSSYLKGEIADALSDAAASQQATTGLPVCPATVLPTQFPPVCGGNAAAHTPEDPMSIQTMITLPPPICTPTSVPFCPTPQNITIPPICVVTNIPVVCQTGLPIVCNSAAAPQAGAAPQNLTIPPFC